ncbi:hypothetical protein MJO28_001846 [Puccinia striiformis f. sp. tritici]|uniref:Uncharacterized protein n=1 Tax=Puccinia striiformis f. sp. tritici TaxID=168172 RepID=A0ACC0EV55_9BASI|nr:hypothetical protein MJO28_001846 [Puccinia striiformis f. sp. tritici]
MSVFNHPTNLKELFELGEKRFHSAGTSTLSQTYPTAKGHLYYPKKSKTSWIMAMKQISVMHRTPRMEDLTLSLTQTVYYQAQYEWWSLDLLTNGQFPETAQHMREVKAKELHIHTARIVTSHGEASTETEWGGHDYRSVHVHSTGQIPLTYILADPVSKTFTRGDLQPGDIQTVEFLSHSDPTHLLVWTSAWIPRQD